MTRPTPHSAWITGSSSRSPATFRTLSQAWAK